MVHLPSGNLPCLKLAEELQMKKPADAGFLVEARSTGSMPTLVRTIIHFELLISGRAKPCWI